MEYIDQSADAIRLYLVPGGYDIAAHFTVLAEAGAAWGSEYWIELDILGESHAFTLYRGDEPLFHEICACSDGVFDAPPIRSAFLHELPLKIETTVTSKIVHTFEHERLEWTAGEARIATIQGRFDVAEQALSQLRYEFPVEDEAVETKPLTAVWLMATEGELALYSVHTYPNESVMVFTRSQVTL